MKFKVLIIGFGSIGKRHASILSKFSTISEIIILSKQKNLPYKTIYKIEDSNKYNPDYFIISSKTSNHYDQLSYIEENFKNKLILVEKPLFHKYLKKIIINNKVFIGYNLRYHPIIKLIKKSIKQKTLWNINAIYGSYLPDWRKNIDYRNSSSASKIDSGGVLLDLSHEIDFVNLFLGNLEVDFVINDKISNLEIETDDFLCVAGHSDHGALYQIMLNYFTRESIRQIIIDGEDISIKADLINNYIIIIEKNNFTKKRWAQLSRNSTYREMHKEILSGKQKFACTYSDGSQTMKIIDKIRKWNYKKTSFA